MSTQYFLQTRNVHGWHRLGSTNYTSLLEASNAVEQYINDNPLKHGKALTKGVFRTVKVKHKPTSV